MPDKVPGPNRKLRSPPTVAPSAPSISSVTRGDRSLGVVWTAPTNTGGGVITAYDVRYIETSEDETMESNWTVRDNAWTSGDLRYIVTGLTNATQYDVQVRAVNSAGDGAWSDTETGTPLPDDIAITLQWEETSIEVAEDAGSVVLKAVFTTTVDTAPEADFTFDVNLTTTDNRHDPRRRLHGSAFVRDLCRERLQPDRRERPAAIPRNQGFHRSHHRRHG